MKILYGITKGNFGGAQRYVFDLAKEMAELGHDVSVLCGQGEILVQKLSEEKIPTLFLPSLNRDISIINDLKSFFEIYKILKQKKPEIFHINSSKMGGIGSLAGRLAGIKKIIFTIHGLAFNENRSRYEKFVIRILYWITILLSHQTICVSVETKRQVANLPFIKNKLSVVHNGIEPFLLKEHVSKEVFTASVLSELHHVKGLDILIRAWSKFIQKHQAKLIIFGEGEERKNLENLIRELGIQDSVELKGYVKNAYLELQNFDLMIMPSRSENLPYSILEAGLAALPVIATKVGGIPEIIENGLNGALVPKEDVEALFSALILYHDNPRMRDRLGAALKERVKKEFSLEKMVRDTLEVYKKT